MNQYAGCISLLHEKHINQVGPLKNLKNSQTTRNKSSKLLKYTLVYKIYQFFVSLVYYHLEEDTI